MEHHPRRPPGGGEPPRLGMIAAGVAPVAALALLATGAGTMPGGATAGGVAATVSIALAAALAAGGRWRDPLALGRSGRVLVWALWLVIVASAWASPVPRAGLLPALLFPGFVLMPAAVARAWGSPAARRWGALAIAFLTAGLCLWALIGRFALGDPRAARPLGHHLLLGVVLLAAWPLGVSPLMRGPGAARRLGFAVWLLTAVTLFATGSLAVWAGYIGQHFLVTLSATRRRWPGRTGTWRLAALGAWVGVIAALCLVALPRGQRILSGTDSSARARAVYLEAGLEGIAERPMLGWGPGSVPWTVAEFLRPRPGVNPPGEMVAELHSLPVQLGYELGLPGLGLAVAIAGLFVLRCRRRRRGRAASPVEWDLGRGAALAGVGAGIASLATGWWAIAALPASLALAAGGALAGSAAVDGGSRESRSRENRRPAAAAWALELLPAVAYAAIVVVWLLPGWQAHRVYEIAARSGDPRAVEIGLTEAVARDPEFPWYRLIGVWTSAGFGPGVDDARAARRAAEDGYAVAPLWLVAGVYGGDQGEPWAAAALDRACRLDPLGALGPLWRLALEPRPEVARTVGARALLAEPRLAVSTLWEKHPSLLPEAVAGVLAAEGVDAGWREALAERVAGLSLPEGPIVEIGLQVDAEAAESMPLRIFRRPGWPAVLAPAPLRASALGRFDLPPATVLESTDAGLFHAADCSLGTAAR